MDEVVGKLMGNNRIDYLSNKYGKFTPEKLNYRVNWIQGIADLNYLLLIEAIKVKT